MIASDKDLSQLCEISKKIETQSISVRDSKC